MITFYICRHGETENNKNQRFSGWIDTPLTERGVQDASKTSSKLTGIQFDKIISSDLGRAFSTAYIISRNLNFTGEIERSRELREVNYGDFANQPYAVYPEVSPSENTDFTAPNGESLAQMQQRVLTYIRKLAAQNPGKTILLVAHDGTINALRAYYNNEPVGIADLTRNPHDSAVKFEFDSDKILSLSEVT